MDVTDEASVRSWTEEAVDAFGGVDIVYANAGAVRFGPDRSHVATRTLAFDAMPRALGLGCG
ncbi:hypothetical protein [Streptomyces sp. DHE17-7]|uniref:hypothetical protein n=1 Tax=Streptomyces sp. DHE17-7 TaxID=2759949 RepID=UPI0022EA941B|nr:hypothetical protein [Streptomyces sp. DHE17-7]MBJ6617908.1 hypothetical protein [Streptomyces sp. DHE17-7]